jgi:hypothetical protein
VLDNTEKIAELGWKLAEAGMTTAEEAGVLDMAPAMTSISAFLLGLETMKAHPEWGQAFLQQRTRDPRVTRDLVDWIVTYMPMSAFPSQVR